MVTKQKEFHMIDLQEDTYGIQWSTQKKTQYEIYSEIKKNEYIIMDTEYKYTEMDVQVLIMDVPHGGNNIPHWK